MELNKKIEGILGLSAIGECNGSYHREFNLRADS